MIYLDNGATSFPKPGDVVDEMVRAMTEYCANPGRSGHSMAVRTGNEIFRVRRDIAGLFNIENPERVIFTGSCTQSLNLALKGILREGDHVITSSMEHNSVMRPLHRLKSAGVKVTVVKCGEDGRLDPDDVRQAVRPETRMIVLTAASNVTGTRMPLEEVGRIALRKGLIFLVDGAQGAGHMELDVKSQHIDVLAAPGHKGLLGPEGTGILYVREGLALKPLTEGGTGSHSADLTQPLDFPEGYEAGTVNAPGIIGLGAAVRMINKIGIPVIEDYEGKLTARLYHELADIGGFSWKISASGTKAADLFVDRSPHADPHKIIFYGPDDPAARTGILALNIRGVDCEEAADLLDKKYGIAVRAGMHCSGTAHETIGTADTGCIRICPGIYNTEQDMIRTAKAIREIADGADRVSE